MKNHLISLFLLQEVRISWFWLMKINEKQYCIQNLSNTLENLDLSFKGCHFLLSHYKSRLQAPLFILKGKCETGSEVSVKHLIALDFLVKVQ